MTTVFDSLDALAAAASVSAFGEVAVLQPRRQSQYVEAAADADRVSVSARGIFSAATATADLRGQARGGEFAGASRVLSGQSAFWISAEQVTHLGFRPAKGDLVHLPDRSGSPSFAIAAVHPTAMGDLNLLLVREDVAA